MGARVGLLLIFSVSRLRVLLKPYKCTGQAPWSMWQRGKMPEMMMRESERASRRERESDRDIKDSYLSVRRKAKVVSVLEAACSLLGFYCKKQVTIWRRN